MTRQADGGKSVGPSPAYMDIVLLSEIVVPPPPSASSRKSALSKPKPVHIIPKPIVNISRSAPLAPPPPFSPPTPSPSSSPPMNTARKCFLALVSTQTRGNELTFTLHRQRVVHSRTGIKNATFSVSNYSCKVLASLTSCWREFLALHEAYRMPLLPHILNPTMSSSMSVSVATPSLKKEGGEKDNNNEAKEGVGDPTSWQMEGVGEAFNAYIHSTFNASQRRAVQCAVEKSKGFSLIQGPPGTGKILQSSF